MVESASSVSAVYETRKSSGSDTPGRSAPPEMWSFVDAHRAFAAGTRSSTRGARRRSAWSSHACSGPFFPVK